MATIKQNIIILTIAIALVLGIALPSISFASFSFPYSNTVAASLTVPNVCVDVLSNTVIAFGSVAPTANAPITNAVVDTNDGNIAANILLDGTNWIASATVNYFVTNTVWDFSAHASGISYTSANSLGLAPGNLVNTFNVIGVSAQVPLYFGTTVPALAAPATYSQTVTIENLC
ncbi:MAG: hypothetical protein KGH66_01520 [Candidatus Micrarchaeota archaeon]|nr:hypothetical protein [Candidatus Micrarchaeota archaeon]